MKTAVVTAIGNYEYLVEFFDGEDLVCYHQGFSRDKVTDRLKASGVDLKSHGPKFRWWPYNLGEFHTFVVDKPTTWFWSKK